MPRKYKINTNNKIHVLIVYSGIILSALNLECDCNTSHPICSHMQTLSYFYYCDRTVCACTCECIGVAVQKSPDQPTAETHPCAFLCCCFVCKHTHAVVQLSQFSQCLFWILTFNFSNYCSLFFGVFCLVLEVTHGKIVYILQQQFLIHWCFFLGCVRVAGCFHGILGKFAAMGIPQPTFRENQEAKKITQKNSNNYSDLRLFLYNNEQKI